MFSEGFRVLLQTMALLSRFQTKLTSAITEDPADEVDVDELDEDDDKGWLVGAFLFGLRRFHLSLPAQ